MLRKFQLTTFFIVSIVFPVPLSTGTSYDEEEYCERETFEASCASDEVILIRSAVFGRMSLGRCVENGFGFLGCSTDVLTEVENLCSGRQQCQFPVGSLHVTRPCPTELISFLRTSYDCVKVTPCPEYSCASGKSQKVSSAEGYLASIVTSSSGCGSDACPWVFEALPGQRFNLTFRSFVRVQTDAKHQLAGRFCQRLATVVERSNQVSKDITLCDDDASVVRMITSAHDEVKLKLYHGTSENPAHFIVHYQAFGCADPVIPDGAWVKRVGDSATVGCHGKSTTWHLVCNGISWTGDNELCRSPSSHDLAPTWNVQAAVEKAGATTEGILLVVGLGIIIGVVVGCSLLSIVIIIVKRRRRRQAQQYERRRLEVLAQYSPGMTIDSAPGKMYDSKVEGCDFQQAAQSLMYDSGFGTYDTHSYTSPLPEASATNFIVQSSGGSSGNKIPDATNCAIHGDHMYESRNFSF